MANFIPKIDNWSVCDSFCTGLKFTKNNLEIVWEFIQPYFSSEKEYDVRFGAVMLLNYFLEPDYIECVLTLLNTADHDGYYARMAVAWTVSLCYIKFPEQTMKFLQNNLLDDFTYNKSLQKIVESNRIDQVSKTLIRSMKRR